MNLKYVFISLLFYFNNQIDLCTAESITYISTERPEVAYFDPKCFNKVLLLNKRLIREDPRYYVELYVDTLITLNNTLEMHFHFFQFLTNRYRPSFVEMHFKLCDLVNSDNFLGISMRKALGNRNCPFLPGVYDLKNMTAMFVPKGFPFAKGRIYLNVTLRDGDVTREVGRANIDMEVKVARLRKKIEKNN